MSKGNVFSRFNIILPSTGPMSFLVVPQSLVPCPFLGWYPRPRQGVPQDRGKGKGTPSPIKNRARVPFPSPRPPSLLPLPNRLVVVRLCCGLYASCGFRIRTAFLDYHVWEELKCSRIRNDKSRTIRCP